MSVISAILMIVLFIAELSIFLTPQREEKITLDQTLNEKMVINFNISMLKIPCSGPFHIHGVIPRSVLGYHGHFGSAANGRHVADREN